MAMNGWWLGGGAWLCGKGQLQWEGACVFKEAMAAGEWAWVWGNMWG